MDPTLQGFCDADWAEDINDRCSTTDYLFTLQGAAVTRSSKKQTFVALSSIEYMSISAACQEAIWLRQLIGEITPKLVTKEIIIKNNNQSVIKLAHNTAYRTKSKHTG